MIFPPVFTITEYLACTIQQNTFVEELSKIQEEHRNKNEYVEADKIRLLKEVLQRNIDYVSSMTQE